MTELPWQEALGAEALYLRMACYCRENLTDGLVPVAEVPRLAYPAPRDVAEQLATLLAEQELIVARSGLDTGLDSGLDSGLESKPDTKPHRSWLVRAYVKRNGTRADVEAVSAQRAAASRHRWTTHQVSHLGDANRNANRNAAGIPTETESETESVVTRAGAREAGDAGGARSTGQTDLDEIVIAELFSATGRAVSREHAAGIRARLLAGRRPANPAAYLRAAIREPGAAMRLLPSKSSARQPPPAAAVVGPRGDHSAEAGRGGKMARELLAAKQAEQAEQAEPVDAEIVDDDDQDAPVDAPF